MACMLVVLPAQGQTLSDLYTLASDFDAGYQRAHFQHDADLARAAQAKEGLLPTMELTAGTSGAQQDVEFFNNNNNRASSAERDFITHSAGVNITQPLYRPANWATYEQSTRRVDIARLILSLAEQTLIIRLSEAYFDVLASRDNLELIRAQKIAVAEQLASGKRNFEIGTSTITDAREAQARYDLVLAQEVAAEGEIEVKKTVLDQLVGAPYQLPTPLASAITLPSIQPTAMNAWVEQAYEVHPAIQKARLDLDVADLEIDKANAGHKPTVDANLGYSITRNPFGTSTSTQGNQINGATVGVTFRLPLFAGFSTENRVKEAHALEQVAATVLDETRLSVARITRTAYLELVSNTAQVKALEVAQASGQSALDANKLGYQVGVRINTDVLNAQHQLYQTKRDLTKTRFKVLLGDLKLRQANGTLTISHLQAISKLLERASSSSLKPWQ